MVKKAPVGSSYRSPHVFEHLWPFMEAENNRSNDLMMNLWNMKTRQSWKPCLPLHNSEAELPKSNGFLIIEANGGLNQQRLSVRDFRIDWDLQVNEPVAGNYYPINLGADVRYESMEMSALVDRAVGRASLVNGQIQLMLHRKQESKVRVGVIALYFGFRKQESEVRVGGMGWWY
ncbi:hypothetical protein L2E82_50372 [Cichorium intybus]|nr:hypothetical protein L2E82_50372 [Cichorium intybus]